MYRLGIILIVVSLAINANAQDNLRIAQVDSLTYSQYLNKDYKALIKTSKAARKEKINFYYLDYRTAIAYYELKNYARAAKFYKKAYAENPDDAFLGESLYYAYLMSGQRENADILAKNLAPHTLATLGHKFPIVDFVSLSGGYMINDNKPSKLETIAAADSLNLYQNMIFSSLTLGFNLSPQAKLKLGYQLYSNDFNKYNKTEISQKDKLEQHQLVLALELFTKNNFSYGFIGGYYNIETFNKGSGAGNGPNRALTKRMSAFSVSAFVNKRFTYLLPEIALSYSNFGNSAQYQVEASLLYYPFGNLNFYGQTKFATIYSPKAWIKNQYIVSQSLGVKLAKPLWLDLSGSYGNHLNYITNHSFLVYDTYNPVKAIAAATLSYYLKNATISAGYQWQQREGWAYYTTYYNTYKYNNHIINLALSWKF